MYLRADLTPVSTLCTRLIICILYMDKTRLRERLAQHHLDNGRWCQDYIRPSEPNKADLLQSTGKIT